MKQHQLLLIFVAIVSVYGCAQSDQNTYATSGSSDEMSYKFSSDEVEVAEEEPGEPDLTRKLIKDGYVEFETVDLQQARSAVLSAVEQVNGYVSSDHEFSETARIGNRIEVRIPTDQFDAFLAAATQGVERFESKNVDVRDVTEEFLDITARLKTKKELELRYHELLKDARNVLEILEIEKQIEQLRSDIESFEGRLKYLNDRVNMATLTLSFYELVPEEHAFGGKFKAGVRNGWENLIWFFVVLTNLWPFVLITLLLVVVVRRYRRRKRASRGA
jgi:hypothetical protein